MKQNFRGSWHVRALLLLCLTFQIPWGGELSHAAQTAQQNTIRIGNVTNLKELIRQIEAQTSYKVSYQGNLADNITIKADPSKHNVEELLADALRGTGISYVIRYNTIILTQEQPRAEAAQQASQTRHIAGRVIDAETKEPIIGATVWVKDSALGTNTNVDGAFDYTFTGHYGYIAVSYIGYQTQEFPVTNLPKVIELSAGNELDEVVVVGYGTQKKASVVGSIASVSVNDIRMPTAKISNNLAGQLAGVISVQRSGEPGASSTFWIRGISTFGSSTTPLVLVDGIERDLDLVDIEDIKDFSILKDAAATAIYGVRGANGVILITTRKAQENVTRITLRQQTTVSGFSSELNLWRDPVLMAMLSNESSINAGLTPTYIGATNANGVYYPSIAELQTTWTTNTRWDDLVFRPTPVSNNTTVQVQSSNDRTMFQASANYYLDNGMYIEDTYRKYGGNFSVEHKLLDNLRMKASANITSNKRHNNGGLAYWRNPIFPVYDDNGDYWLYGAQDYSHPLALTNLQKNDSKGLDIISFASVNWDVLPGLNVMAQFNYKHGEQITDNYFPKKYSETGVFNDGYGSIDNWKDDNIVFEAYATFDRTFAEKHRLTVMGGYSYENYQSRSSSLAAKGFINESLGNENLAAGDSETYSIGNSSYKTELVSALTRINYTFDNRFLFTFTARADGSSKFGSNNKWAFFPSGAFSWKMHEERFIRDLNVFDVLKIRASYGISGNQGISAYQTLSRYGQHKYFNGGKWVTAIGPGYQSGYTGQDGIYALWSGIPNKGLKWETTAQADLGLDMSFFGNRLNVTFDWYDKRTSDLLRERNIAPSSGYDKMWVNDGEIRNRGIELTIDGVAFQNRDWRVGGTFVFSRNRNKVLSLGNAVQTGLKTDLRTGMQYEYYGNQSEQFRAYTNILAVGQPMYVFYGYRTDGIVQSLAEGLSAGLSGDDAQPGEFKYMDIYDGDGLETVDENDMCIIGDPNPDWMASLGIDVSWRRFDFSIFFNGVFGNDVLNTKRFDQPSNMPMRWTADNPTNSYPRLNANRQTKLSDWWVEDGSFVRIQTMTLGYSIPFSKKDAARKIRLYVSADNLYTFTGFEGYDPEVGMTGIYSGGYPRLRKWTFGADFTF